MWKVFPGSLGQNLWDQRVFFTFFLQKKHGFSLKTACKIIEKSVTAKSDRGILLTLLDPSATR